MNSPFHLRCACVFVLAILAIGCGQEQRLALPDSSLKGKIVYKGKPVPYALVIVTSGSQSSTGNADDEGNYKVPNVGPGEVQIGVNTDAGRGHMMSATMASAQTGDKSLKPSFVDLPKKFFEPGTSGITTKIENPKGENVFDISIR